LPFFFISRIQILVSLRHCDPSPAKATITERLLNRNLNGPREHTSGLAFKQKHNKAASILSITPDREDRKARVIRAGGKTVLRFRVQYDQLALVTDLDASPLLREHYPL
jgi:hypothetical protein